MISALLQVYVEDVFQDAARRALRGLQNDQAAFELYWKQMKDWGNPNPPNIKRLFLKIGIHDVFSGLSWQKATTETVKQRLDQLNQIRNAIAHGRTQIKVNDKPYSLTLAKVVSFRELISNFSERFESHVKGLVY